MLTEELILQQTALLPEELKQAVLLYINFVVQQYQKQENIVITTSNTPTDRRGLFGVLKGKIWMADDFDAPLTEEFADYM